MSFAPCPLCGGRKEIKYPEHRFVVMTKRKSFFKEYPTNCCGLYGDIFEAESFAKKLSLDKKLRVMLWDSELHLMLYDE